MASLDNDEVILGENGSATRRTRSGRSVKTPGTSTRSSRSKKQSQKPAFDDSDELKDMSKNMSYFEQEDAFEHQLSFNRNMKNDSPPNTMTRAFGEESNGSMDGMLKTCFEDNIQSEEGIPFEPMDVTIEQSPGYQGNYPLEEEEKNDYFDIENQNSEAAGDEDETESEAIEAQDNTESMDPTEAGKSESLEPVESEPPSAGESEEGPSSGEKSTPRASTENQESPMEDVEGGEADTEVVSEDELPLVEKPEVKDAENVSDDELPGPKPAELPADTEFVSEDELPSSKKETRKRKTGNVPDSGYDPGSPTSENESSPKKLAISKDGENKPQPSEKRSSEDKTSKKKALPELDKYWKAVNDDASDFTGWTYLLQYVDQENDVEAAREAYDAFLSHYPYCYGYWRKYADYEKRKGSKKKCLEVLERGLRAIPLSVDLWIHYLNHIKTTRPDDSEHIRQQYERALSVCGIEFRCDRLWESYIKWETENGTLPAVTALYDRLLSTPTIGYTTHFDNFQEYIMSHPANSCISVSSFLQFRNEVRAEMKNEPQPDSDPDIPPGEEEADDHLRSDDESAAIKERIIASRRKIHKLTIDQVLQRWNFEEGIKRPYFHVKPLERCQLKNWKAYLEWEEQKCDSTRTLVLYERCLIACALYDEFWLRLVQYLENRTASLTDEDEEERTKLIARTRDVLERACTIHHLDKPILHLRWAFFEEGQGCTPRAAEILERLDKTCPNLLQVALRRINLERRRGDLDKCCQLYESYIASSKSKGAASNLSMKYARFLMRFKSDPAAATEALRAATTRDPTCQRLYLQMADITMTKPDFDLAQVIAYFDEYLAVEGIDTDSKIMFAQRKLELLEEMSGSVSDIQAALNVYQTLAKQQHKKKNKDKVSGSDGNSGKKKGDASAPPLPPNNMNPASANSGANSGYGGYSASSYGYSAPPPSQPAAQSSYDNTTYPPQPYQAQWPQYQQPPNPYQHNPWTPYQNYY